MKINDDPLQVFERLAEADVPLVELLKSGDVPPPEASAVLSGRPIQWRFRPSLRRPHPRWTIENAAYSRSLLTRRQACR
ncbi:MAG: hypothetical protein ACYCW6_15915 [Candidatus Xenobia bacterium]